MVGVKMNETINETINQVGNATSGNLLNLSWSDSAAQGLNGLLNTGFFTGETMTYILSIITLLLLYWKWKTILSFIEMFGSVIILLGILFLGLKMFKIF